MAKKKKPDTICGVIVINKHEGVTSHRIVSILRKMFDTPRVGHTGTLDPMATGVLPILLGRAVKASEYVMAEDKRYIAEMKLGITTDTEDVTGEILSVCENIPDEEKVIAAVSSFVGEYEQTPPMYSAIKVGGQKLVDIARKGETVQRKSRKVKIDSCTAKKISPDVYRLDIRCSKGTYIRTLCSDIGALLGCGAAMSSLCRVSSGSFTIDKSYSIEDLEKMTFEERLRAVTPVDELFTELEELNLNEFYLKLFVCGAPLYQKKLKTSYPDGKMLKICRGGRFIGLGKVAQIENDSVIKSEKLFDLSLFGENA